jgi:hypothetical protein
LFFFYIDNNLIFSKTREEHQQHVIQVLERLKEHSLFASPKKCTFYADQVTFLGFSILAQGIKMELSKLNTIREWPYPKNLKELGHFLGYTNFYRKLIRGFLALEGPLTALTKEKVDTVAGLKTAEFLTAFNHLKSYFEQAPLLMHFVFLKYWVLHVDGSKYALSEVLSQYNNTGVLHLVSFLSKKWSYKESAWQCHNQELGAIVQAFVEWRA